MCFNKCPKAYQTWKGSRFSNKTSDQIRSRISHDFQWCSPNLRPDPSTGTTSQTRSTHQIPALPIWLLLTSRSWWSGWRERHRSEMYRMTTGKTETEGRQIWGKKHFAHFVFVPTELWSFIKQRHMPNWTYLVTLGSTSHPFDALLTFLPGLGRCSLRKPDHHTSWLQLQPDWRRGGLVGRKLCQSGRHWNTDLRDETICFCPNGVESNKRKSQIGSNLWCLDNLGHLVCKFVRIIWWYTVYPFVSCISCKSF